MAWHLRGRRRLGFALLMALCALLAAGALALWSSAKRVSYRSAYALEDIPFNGRAAMDHLERLVALGPRPSGSPGMQAQQALLQQHFAALAGRVWLQRFKAPHPAGGAAVEMANLVVQWRPERRERILLAAHYDTLPFPALDPVNPRGVFVGANDGASGVAVLMELGKSMESLVEKKSFGVDFVFFDGEEFVFDVYRGRYFLGSEYFAQAYAAGRAAIAGRYRAAVLLDMVGDAELEIYQERNSMWWSDSRPVAEALWATAARLGVREFIAEKRHEVQDDHLMLHNVGGIAAVNIIDFDYSAWHTEQDTPSQCSPLSLAKVGWVVGTWLEELDD